MGILIAGSSSRSPQKLCDPGGGGGGEGKSAHPEKEAEIRRAARTMHIGNENFQPGWRRTVFETC